jgi:cytidylate kinase
VDEEAMRREVEARDLVDTQRAVAPLRPAADAVIVDTDGLSVDEVVDLIVRHVHERHQAR